MNDQQPITRAAFDKLVAKAGEQYPLIAKLLRADRPWHTWPPHLQADLFKKTGYRPTTMFVKTEQAEDADAAD